MNVLSFILRPIVFLVCHDMCNILAFNYEATSKVFVVRERERERNVFQYRSSARRLSGHERASHVLSIYSKIEVFQLSQASRCPR